MVNSISISLLFPKIIGVASNLQGLKKAQLRSDKRNAARNVARKKKVKSVTRLLYIVSLVFHNSF